MTDAVMISISDVKGRLTRLAIELDKPIPSYQQVWEKCLDLTVIPPGAKRGRLPEEALPIVRRTAGSF